jgi:hypothetical protein
MKKTGADSILVSAEWPSSDKLTRLGDTPLRLCERRHAAFRFLAEAWDLAEESGRNCWDFAVEVQTLRELGLNDNELRWMVYQDLAEHAQEVTAVGDTCRVFRPERPLRFSEDTCFALTERGLKFVRELLGCEGASLQPPGLPSTLSVNSDGRPLVPKWYPDRQELRVGEVTVKQFKVPAENQEAVLAAFEEEGWPVHVYDPLPPQTDQDPKRRLHNTINSLNRHQKHPLIRFIGNGNGQGIRWEFLTPGQPIGTAAKRRRRAA